MKTSKTSQVSRVSVVGAGSFGTCIAALMANKGYAVTLWGRSDAHMQSLARDNENARYLPGIPLPKGITFTSDLAEVLPADIIFMVTPSKAAAGCLSQLAPHTGDAIVVNTAKGIMTDTLETLDQVYDRVLPNAVADRAVYLSGPTFAKEIAKGMPAAAAVAGRDADTVATVQAALSSDVFRAYSCSDVKGLLLGGALKNVIAIAAGIGDGLGLGHNARAAIITRGLAEISRIGVALGADPLTFAGLSGMGDLVLTCSGDLSRNRRVGLGLGRGQELDAIVANLGMVAEGVRTCEAAYKLATKLDVDAPATVAVHKIIFDSQPVRQVFQQLMRRSLRAE